METEPFILRQNDWLPNNERLPVPSIAELSKLRGRRPRNASNGCSPNMAVIALPDHRLRRFNVRVGFARSSRWRTTIESALKIEMERPFTPN